MAEIKDVNNGAFYFGALTKEQAKLIAPLTLAFVGDAVQALYVKTTLALDADFKQRDLQIKVAKIVRAQSQAKVYEELLPFLSEDELHIAMRARNAKTNNTPKNASSEEYHKATALEALIGYYYLVGDGEKLGEIMQKCIDKKTIK